MKRSLHIFSYSLYLPLFLLGLGLGNVAVADQETYEKCLLREMKNATANMRVNDLKDACTPEKLDTVEPVSQELLEDEKKEQCSR